ELRTSEPVIVGPGTTSGALYQADHRAPTIYNMDMGYATAICLGLALAVPGERVVALEGDGSILSGIGVLSTIGRYAPPNLIVVVFHNGFYASCGDGQVPTAAASTTDLGAVARACGIDPQHVVPVATLAEARKALRAALTEPGPWIVVAEIEHPDRWPAGRPLPRHDLVETAVAFKREVMNRGYRSGGPASEAPEAGESAHWRGHDGGVPAVGIRADLSGPTAPGPAILGRAPFRADARAASRARRSAPPRRRAARDP